MAKVDMNFEVKKIIFIFSFFSTPYVLHRKFPTFSHRTDFDLILWELCNLKSYSFSKNHLNFSNFYCENIVMYTDY